ncbi:DUF2141 domain-containing protein [Novosphingobium sp.]|uniref:DUF2141 domain-containing protein n=1 Tax=Novosphingobium sp. TaxID=1874826 RepID=UPI0026003AC1|nr:DUF2141 domain-containing protein [Novosphingobium sp.]
MKHSAVARHGLRIAGALAAWACIASTCVAQPLLPPAECVGEVSDTWLYVAVTDVRKGTGLVAFTIYDDDRSRFLVKRGSLAVMRVPAQLGETRACIFLPRAGTYALAVYHDEDGNQAFNRSGLGLPNEGFGFSNNPTTLAGLPSFKAVRLSVPKPGLLTRIRLKYP